MNSFIPMYVLWDSNLSYNTEWRACVLWRLTLCS